MDKIIKTSLTNTLATRTVDDLGRIIIPKPIRQIVGINPQDTVEIYYDKNRKIVAFKLKEDNDTSDKTDESIKLKINEKH